MIASYATLLTLAVSHAYYGGITDELSFVLPADAARVLGRGRLLSRVDAGTFRVLFDGGTTGTPRISMAGSTLRVALVAATPDLAIVTDPPLPVAPNVAYYRNRTSPTALDAPETRTLTGSTLVHTITQATRPVTLTVEDDGGTPLATATVAGSDATASFDLGSVAPGPLSVKEDYGGGSTSTVLYFLHPEARPRRRLGGGRSRDHERLLHGGAGVPDQPRRAPGHAQVLPRRLELPRGRLQRADRHRRRVHGPDRSAAADRVHARGERRVRAGRPPRPAAGVRRRPGRDVQVQRGRGPPAAGAAKIQLSGSTDVLVENLPQPGANRVDANMILHISK